MNLVAWLIDPNPPEWIIEALHSLKAEGNNVVTIEKITNAERWVEKSEQGAWPTIIITEYDLGWSNAHDIVQTLSLEPTGTFVALLSDEPSEAEIALLFEEGIDIYMRKTPPQPHLLQKRIERLLRIRPSLMQERLNLGTKVKEITSEAKNTAEIAVKVLPLVTNFLKADWGGAFLKEDFRISTLCTVGTEVEISPEMMLKHNLLREIASLRVSVKEMPREVSAAFFKKGLQTLNVYRLFSRDDATEWFVFGWAGTGNVVRERKQLVSEMIQWIGAASQRAYSEGIERARRQETEVLASVMLRLNHALSEEKVAKEVLSGMKKLVPYDRASIWLLSPKGKLKIAALEGFNSSPEHVENAVHKFKPPIEEWSTVQISIHARRPLLLEDTKKFHEWHDLLGEQPVRSWMGVPILYDERVLGITFLDSFSPNAFGEKHLNAVQRLMTAAGTAFHNARLFAQRLKWQKRSAALRWITLQMISTSDPQEVLRQLVSEALSLMNAEDVHIFFYDAGRLVFVAGEYKGEPVDKPYWQPRPNGITYTAVRQKQPIVVPDAQNHPLFADKPWEGAIVSVPLIVRRQLLGVMNIAWDKPREFPDEEIDLLRNLAEYAAIALDNARLISSLEKRVHDLTKLARLGETMRSMRHGKALARLVVENAAALADADVSLIVRRISENEMVLRAAYGLSPEVEGIKIPVGTSICDRSGSAFETATFQNLRPEEILPSGAREISVLKSALVLSLKAKGKKEPTGCLLVGWKEKEGSISSETINTLQLLTAMLVNTLERARAQAELEDAFIQAVTALSRALDERDHYHGGHSERLSQWSEILARELGCSEEEIEIIKQAALLHDIGKIGIPDKVLHKPASLTEKEWEVIRQHPLIGARILRPLERLRPVAEIVEAHHERWNGSGYPHGLKGEEIPLGARIIAVLDSYSAMVDKRVYQDAMSHEQAVEEIRRGAGTLYDPRVVEAFLRVVDTFKEDELKPQTDSEKGTAEKETADYTDYTENLRYPA